MKANPKIWAAVIILAAPLFLQASLPQVKIIKGEGDLPERFCDVCQKGDYFLSDGKNLIVIGVSSRNLGLYRSNYINDNARGCIISFVPAGKNLKSNMIIGLPRLMIEEKRNYVNYTSLTPLKKNDADRSVTFQATADFEDKEGRRAHIRTSYHLFPETGKITLSSIMKNTGKKEFDALNYSIYCGANHSYSFSPFDNEKHPALRFTIYPKYRHSLGWVSLDPIGDDENPLPGKLSPGDSYEVRYILLLDTKDDRLLEKIYQIIDVEPEKATVNFNSHDGDTTEVIIKNALTSSIFYRSFLKKPDSLEILLPKGVYTVQANFFPAVVEKLLHVEKGKDNSCSLEHVPMGTINVKIIGSEGEFVPGKVTIIGLDPTKSPYFRPENPIESGREWETFKNSRYPRKDGLDVPLPAGTYLIFASRGPEFSRDLKAVEILKNEHRELIFQIEKVVNTDYLIAVDPHMHTVLSDGSAHPAERIKSIAAEGIEVAVATDHNLIYDYNPVLKKLGLNKYLAAIIGNEVSVRSVIHYNSYPLIQKANERRNGAIDPVWEEAPPLFQASRKTDPQALIQVNHPRGGILGYFNNYQLDQNTAAFARTHFDTSFDVLEVMNGPLPYLSNSNTIKDWLNLLNRGYYFPIVGSSDSHDIDRDEPGYSRTYVYYSGGKGDDLDQQALIRAMKKGHSFASNGPIVDMKINDKYIPGDSFSSPGKEVNIRIKVQGAPWISVNEIKLIMNGERKIIMPVKFKQNAVVKFDEELECTLKEDSYIVAEVIGEQTLYPILQRMAKDGLAENAALAYALTNPIFVDVDGNGKFNPPTAEKIEFTDHPKAQKIIKR